ncbi:MAG: hypothetical protein ACO3QC_01410 [Phycisphaerales bacterium]
MHYRTFIVTITHMLPAITQLFRLAASISARFAMLSVALWLCLGVCMHGCDDGKKTSGSSMARAQSKPSSGDLDLIDPGDEIVADSAKVGGAAPRRAPSTRDVVSGDPMPSSARGRWSVMLATFTQEDHASRANAFRTELVREYPELSRCEVRRVGKGSAIVIGRFDAPADDAAQAELKRVKAIERADRKPFAASMLVRTSTDDSAAVRKPRDIRNLRARYPKVRPLFSLQVAAWSTFGEKGADYAPMRAAAERYCAELVSKGQDAWFHHDDDSETSIVTVGFFDKRAYDAKSTLFSPEVEDLMRQFPAHLLNGEPLLIPIDPSNPKGRSKPQPCRLVEVPEL